MTKKELAIVKDVLVGTWAVAMSNYEIAVADNDEYLSAEYRKDKEDAEKALAIVERELGDEV